MDTSSGPHTRRSRALTAALLLSGTVTWQHASGQCCPADLDKDKVVGSADFLIVLNQWGQTCAPIGDLDHDGVVGTADLLAVLSAWGPCVGADCCREDLNEDNLVGTPDLLIMLSEWDQVGPSSSDVNGDGIVGSVDFLQLLSNWGSCIGPNPELMLACWTSPQVRVSATSRGWAPVPLITHRFHYDAIQDRFDAVEYLENIWWPQWSPDWQIPGTITPQSMCERFGIPNDDENELFNGWVDLDFERYAPIRNPEEHESSEVLRIYNSYMALVAATRALRPNAKTILHGLVNRYESEAGRFLIESIVAQHDAVSPSIFPEFEEGFPDLNLELNRVRARMEFCKELRATYGVKVIPIVWKRYFPKDHGDINPLSDPPEPFRIVMPEWVAREILAVVLEYQPDGIIVFGSDGKNHYLVEPNWPTDTPNGAAVDATTEEFLALIEDMTGQ